LSVNIKERFFGVNRPPLFCWRPDRDFAIAMFACLLIVPINGAKFIWTPSRTFIDWIPLNFFILWLTPLVWFWVRGKYSPAFFWKGVGRVRFFLGFGICLLVVLSRPYDFSGPHDPIGSLGFFFFQLAVQTSEVLFFFLFVFRRAEKATGIFGAIILTTAAYVTFQTTSTEPMNGALWLTELAHSIGIISIFSLIPHVGICWLFQVLVSISDQSHELQTGITQTIVAVDAALAAAQAFALYAATLALAAWKGPCRLRARISLAVLAAFFLLLGVYVHFTFVSIRSDIQVEQPWEQSPTSSFAIDDGFVPSLQPPEFHDNGQFTDPQ
jgi:hypothetical protein